MKMYLISYDIPGDKMRAMVAKELENYGVRIQYSVFECSLTHKRYKELYEKLLRLTFELEGGSIRIYFICETCSAKTITIGEPIHKLQQLSQNAIII